MTLKVLATHQNNENNDSPVVFRNLPVFSRRQQHQYLVVRAAYLGLRVRSGSLPPILPLLALVSTNVATDECFISTDVPQSYKEATSRGNADLWMPATRKEESSIERNKTWDLVKRTSNMNFPPLHVRFHVQGLRTESSYRSQGLSPGAWGWSMGKRMPLSSSSPLCVSCSPRSPPMPRAAPMDAITASGR